MILVDSCVVIDVLENDPQWAEWSQRQLDAAALNHDLIINAVIYTELSVGFRSMEGCEAMLAAAKIGLQDIPREALFLAGKAFQRYQVRGGSRTGVLPDFFIGAHASVLGIPLLTRDVRRYSDYFPRLALIAPGVAEER